MALIDLTLPAPEALEGKPVVVLKEVPIPMGGETYTGMCYDFTHHSMIGTYIDFPGHIKETDDGTHAENYPAEDLFRMDAKVVRLDRESGSGAIEADELAAACPGGAACPGLIVNALGRRRFDEIENRSVYLTPGAVRWIVETGARVLVSDVYESTPTFQGVFRDLFAAGVSTVCSPINLDKLTAPVVKLTVLSIRVPGVTQIPCRALAEV